MATTIAALLTTTPVAAASSPGVRPAVTVWPHAVSRVPAHAPDGPAYEVIMALDAKHLLLATVPRLPPSKWPFVFDPERFDVYDTASKTSTELTRLPRTPGLTNYNIDDVAVSERHIVWQTTAFKNADEDLVVEMWYVPRSGGQAVLLRSSHRFEHASPERRGNNPLFQIVADDVVWQSGSRLYRIPLTGGTPTQTVLRRLKDGDSLLTWPWIGHAAIRWDAPKILRNIVTGRTIRVRPHPGATRLSCEPRWCTGITKGHHPMVQRPDGSGFRVLPGERTTWKAPHLWLGRIAITSDRHIADLRTGRTATSDFALYAPWSGLLVAPRKRMVLNLKAIK
ncbi:hypothetical protein J5X84_44570 [Streptosporangiaceae bacterium NEAU-GS5]|nr:hypothetical protein [Streptosporangiaceae bacterium NEAU-GS5]